MPIVLSPTTSGVWSWSLIDADGTEHALDGTLGIDVLWGPAGLLMPPISMVDRELPLKEGGQLMGVRVATRELDIPMVVKMETVAGLVNRHEELLSWLDPSRGPIKIRVTRPDDTQRELAATYLGGLEGDETMENGVGTWWRGVASFRAHEPYWSDVEDTTVTYTLASVAGSWFPLTFPILLGGSQVLSSANVDNSGTAPAWPRWVVTGPGQTPILRNLTTGKFLGLTWPLGAGETLTIDTAPLVSVPAYDQGGTNRYQTRLLGSERWALEPGVNRVQVEMSSATAASSVVLSYRRRWLRR